MVIYTRDHPPPHVHVWREGHEAIITIDPEPRIRENNGLNRRELAIAVLIVEQNHVDLLRAWRRIHG